MAKQNRIIKKIKTSGLTEFIFLSVSIVLAGIWSRIRIFFLRLRSYNVDYSVDLKPNVVFFQSNKHSIKVGPRTRIGFATRLKAGFDGKISIGKGVWLDDFSFIHSQEKIEIGDGCMIATSVYIVDFDHKLPAKIFDFQNVKRDTYIRSTVVS